LYIQHVFHDPWGYFRPWKLPFPHDQEGLLGLVSWKRQGLLHNHGEGLETQDL
jgi:hypothetical protein